MKKLLVVLFVASLVISVNGSTFAQSGSVTIDGVTSNITFNEFALPFPPFETFFVGFATISTGNGNASVSAIMSDKGFISYFFAGIDLGGPSEFELTCDVPIDPAIDSSNTVDADLSGYTFDFLSKNGVTLTPINGAVQIAEADGENLGVDLGTGLAAGPGFSVYGPFNAGPQAGPEPPAGGFNTLSIEVGFELSGGFDSASLSGFVGIEEN